MAHLIAVEDEQEDDTHRDAGVGEVEHRTEEDEGLSAPDGNPLGPRRFYQREVEHVDHLAQEEGSVARAEGNDVGDIERVGGTEDHAVEHAVDDVPRRSSHDHGQADHIASRGAALDELHDIPADGDDGHDAERAQHILVDERHAEGHAAVLHEVDIEPRCHLAALMQSHIGLDQNFDDLVNDYQRDKDDGGQAAVVRFLHFQL